VKYEQNQLSKKAGTILEGLGGAVGVQNEYICIYIYIHMGVSINGGSSKRLVLMENPIKMDDLGVSPFQETSIYITFAITLVS